MSDEFPLYPTLGEAGENEAQAIINKFKADMVKAADEALSDLYCDVVVHIESDSWTNFANEIMAGFKNYDNRKIQSKYDFKTIRQEIYKEYREDIIKDLDQDILEENNSLKKTNAQLHRMLNDRH